ncbi:putative ribonuclease H-like domain-containing protein [Tanacetum coccineum]
MDLEEMDLKWQMAMLSVRVHRFEQKAGRKIDLIRKESARFTRRRSDVTSVFKEATLPENAGQREEMTSRDIPHSRFRRLDRMSDGVIAPKEFDLIAGCDTEDAIEEGAAKIYNLINVVDTKEASTAGDVGEFCFMGVTVGGFAKADSMKCASTSFWRLHSSIRFTLTWYWESQNILWYKVSNLSDSNSVLMNLSLVKTVDKSSEVQHKQDFAYTDSSENPYSDAEDEGIFDSGCSRSMTGNMERLDDFQEFSRREKVDFWRMVKVGLLGKGQSRHSHTGFLKLSYYVNEHESWCPRGNLACLVAKASVDESVKWHRRMGHGLGHEWYFDLDYLTDTLGYNRDKSNQSVGTQEALTNPAEVEPKDTSGDEVDDSPLDSAEEMFFIGACKAEVSPGSTPVPTGSILVPSGYIVIVGDVSVPTSGVPVPTGSLTDSFFDDEPTTRFPSPSDLGNNEPSPSIFSSSSYDDEFGADLNNLASTVEVSPVATKRINTIHPQSLIIRDHTSAVQMRSKLRPLKIQAGLMLCNEEETTVQVSNVCGSCDLPEEEGIDYDEVFAPVARIEAIRLFLAFASYMGFMVYQMDVKSAFLYGRIDEEVYVTQPKGFWILKTSSKKHKRDIILVQVYVDDIIFGSTKKAWCDEFEALMKGEFEMSAMGELTFFLGLQVQQRPDESMIGSLMYLTASRPDIMFAVSACSRNQVTPTTSNLEAVKEIFKYLKGHLCWAYGTLEESLLR